MLNFGRGNDLIKPLVSEGIRASAIRYITTDTVTPKEIPALRITTHYPGLNIDIFSTKIATASDIGMVSMRKVIGCHCSEEKS